MYISMLKFVAVKTANIQLCLRSINMMMDGADDTKSTPFLAAPYSFFLAAPFFGARER